MTAHQRHLEETPELGELPNIFGLLLRLAQVRHYDRFFAAFEGTDVRPGEMTLLWLLDLNPGIRQGVAARTLLIKPAHMTKVVQRLIDAGLISRLVPEGDRRSVTLNLTDAGRAHLARHRETFLNVSSAESIGLAQDEYDTLLALLRKLAF
ncbi:MarR family winged helix-turn-helix transcriptional regulator [Paracoccus sp. (in: a-proteobacteria)]|uniref:MarR family winged helix-turn-helix transcriptional regulator n=1 Tax=Paracoccus sp. TaxID=267 RepID=UPI00272CC400|nr:MarR family transcriptional regulator [Paracoccus sp. (in: a-proteobacteria)]